MLTIMRKQEDILKLFRNLDISATMYKNAVDKYKALSAYFESKGIECTIYPQGSFALGLVTRPFMGGKDKNYDLDVICELTYDKSKITPEALKKIIGDALKESHIYSDKLLDEFEKCWTLEFAEINEVTFNMDIIPSIKDSKFILEFSLNSNFLAITNKTPQNLYEWININPKDYQKWFEDINTPFLDHCKESERTMFMEAHRKIYNTAEEVPQYFIKSPLQRVIQLLKRHRDIYFSIKNENEKKPISAIISTLCTSIAEKSDKSVNDLELLSFIVTELNIYSKLLIESEDSFYKLYAEKMIIKRNKGKWEILNPVNSEDNLADSWNKDGKKADLFFSWIKELQNTFLNYNDRNDKEFFTIMESSFGSTFINKLFDRNKYTMPETSVLNTPKKSWGI